MAFEILTVLALLQISLAPDMTCIVGILRGGGDTHVGFWFDCGGLWLIGVPLGLITGLVLHLPAPIVFLCYGPPRSGGGGGCCGRHLS